MSFNKNEFVLNLNEKYEGENGLVISYATDIFDLLTACGFKISRNVIFDDDRYYVIDKRDGTQNLGVMFVDYDAFDVAVQIEPDEILKVRLRPDDKFFKVTTEYESTYTVDNCPLKRRIDAKEFFDGQGRIVSSNVSVKKTMAVKGNLNEYIVRRKNGFFEGYVEYFDKRQTGANVEMTFKNADNTSKVSEVRVIDENESAFKPLKFNKRFIYSQNIDAGTIDSNVERWIDNGHDDETEMGLGED